jgi:radical SAM enzyme (TIGR01210 family)
VLQRRGPKNALDPWKPYAVLREEEIGEDGAPVPTMTVFLTNRECPYRCLMCDLWKNTLDARVPLGAIPAQIEDALVQDRVSGVREGAFPDTRYPIPDTPAGAAIKLYNAGSFFDPQAIPPEDYTDIARLVAPFSRVIVECHPALIGERTLRFRDLLAGRLEVAVGLETAHPQALAKLNKGITVDSFRRAAAFLARHDIALRVFLLLRPPFLDEREGLEWAKRSLDLAFDGGASVCCLIPTRPGNGAMEALAASGDCAPPSLVSL